MSLGDRSRTLVAVSHTGLRSGAEKVLLQYLLAARDAGWSVRCARPRGPFDDELAAHGIHGVHLPELKAGSGPRAAELGLLAARSLAAARRISAEARPAGVVLVNGIVGLPAVRAARLRTPVVWLVHDVVVRPDLRRLGRLVAGAVDRAVAVSRAAGTFPDSLGIPTDVVPNGVVVPPLRGEPAAEGPPVVGINAMITPWKGQHVLLEAAALLPPDVRIELLGGTFPKDGRYLERLRLRARQPDLAGRVEFLGHVDDPFERMRTWTVSVSASVDPEAGPLAVLESMSLGLPVVATAHGGAAEFLGDAGLLVPPGDAPAMADAIAKLLADPALRQLCSAAGRAAIAASHRIEDVCRTFLDVLDEVAARSGAST